MLQVGSSVAVSEGVGVAANVESSVDRKRPRSRLTAIQWGTDHHRLCVKPPIIFGSVHFALPGFVFSDPTTIPELEIHRGKSERKSD